MGKAEHKEWGDYWKKRARRAALAQIGFAPKKESIGLNGGAGEGPDRHAVHRPSPQLHMMSLCLSIRLMNRLLWTIGAILTKDTACNSKKPWKMTGGIAASP